MRKIDFLEHEVYIKDIPLSETVTPQKFNAIIEDFALSFVNKHTIASAEFYEELTENPQAAKELAVYIYDINDLASPKTFGCFAEDLYEKMNGKLEFIMMGHLVPLGYKVGDLINFSASDIFQIFFMEMLLNEKIKNKKAYEELFASLKNDERVKKLFDVIFGNSNDVPIVDDNQELMNSLKDL
jgi:hypothetical protein